MSGTTVGVDGTNLPNQLFGVGSSSFPTNKSVQRYIRRIFMPLWQSTTPTSCMFETRYHNNGSSENSYIPAPIITFEKKRVGQVVEVVHPRPEEG